MQLMMVAALATLGCGGSEPVRQSAPAQKARPSEPPVPAEVVAAAEQALGLEVTVLAHGNLAANGETHALIANLLKVTPTGVAPGTLFTRAAIIRIEKDGKWRELFRCEKHLRNTEGFLGGNPLAPIEGWRLQREMSKEKGIVLYFTPIRQPAGSSIRAICVRWNPKVKRYQSLDFNYQDFLGELKALASPEGVRR
jgi:hypothetical protein